MFPALEGDTVYTFNLGTQAYDNAYGYFGVSGVGALGVDYGWLHADTPTDFGGPVLAVGASFFVLKVGAAAQAWTRTFSVN